MTAQRRPWFSPEGERSDIKDPQGYEAGQLKCGSLTGGLAR
jgi:hypothetical protein